MWRFALVLLVACSQPSRSPHGGDGSGTAAAPDAAVAVVLQPDATPPPASPTEAECDVLVDHLLDITHGPDYTDEDRATAHPKLAADFVPACLQMVREQYDCLLAAPDKAAFGACGD